MASLEKENIMPESYSKWINLLIHGLEETETKETKKQTKTILDNFVSNALRIELDDTNVFDLHRLSQYPTKNSR